MKLMLAFDVEAPFLTLSELSRRSDMPLTTTHRLLEELVEHGLVERRDDKSYRLGVRLWELACRTPGALGLRETAAPFMQQLHGSVRQHTQLGVLDGTEVLFIERLSRWDAVVNLTVIGGRMPLSASSSGLILLAYADDEVLDAVIEHGLTRFTDFSITSPERLRAVVAEARTAGHVVSDGLIHVDTRGIAVPVVGTDGHVVAALSVIVPNDDRDSAPLVAELKHAAQGISASLRAAHLPAWHPKARPGGCYRALVNSSQPSMEYLAAQAQQH